MPRRALAAAVVLSILTGCGASAHGTFTVGAVTKAFAAHGIALHSLRPSPDAPVATFVPASAPSESNFVVWVYPTISEARAGASHQSRSLRAAAKNWEQLTGRRVTENRYVMRIANVVLLRGVGVHIPMRRLSAALTQLTAK